MPTYGSTVTCLANAIPCSILTDSSYSWTPELPFIRAIRPTRLACLCSVCEDCGGQSCNCTSISASVRSSCALRACGGSSPKISRRESAVSLLHAAYPEISERTIRLLDDSEHTFATSQP